MAEYKPGAHLLLIIGIILSFGLQIAQSEDAEGDNLFEYGPSIDRQLNMVIGSERIADFKFRFYGRDFNYLYISVDGHISFGENPAQVHKEPLPYKAYPTLSDPPMAAVYFTEISRKTKPGDVDEAKSTVYYRVLHSNDDKHTNILNELAKEVLTNSVTKLSSFSPTHGLIVTWHNVRHQGCFDAEKECPRNTFQVALVTDNQWSYAIYNYKSLTWLGGMSQGCDDVGKGPTCFAAQAGFNAGEAREFTALPFSNKAEILSLTQHRESKVSGRYIYRVSHGRIVRDACTTVPGMQPLTVSVESAGMLGGSELYAAGPCLASTSSTVHCHISQTEVVGRVLNTGCIACVLPPLSKTGDVEVSVRHASEQQYKTIIQIDPPKKIYLPVKLHDYHSTWLQRNPEILSLSWEPLLLNSAWLGDDGNATVPGKNTSEVQVKKVDIILLGYKDIAPAEPKREINLQLLTVLATGNENNGQFTFRPADHRCAVDNCDWHVGMIKVQAEGLAEDVHGRGLVSEAFPLGWYMEDFMTEKHGKHWPEKLCRQWHEPDGEWGRELIHCPCTASQAYADNARFIIGADCEETDPPTPCPLTPEAKTCYISAIPTSHGSGSTCCYNDDGNLIYSADHKNGSYSARAHELGVRPYGAPGRVPILSHWVIDKLPRIWCCVWSTDASLCLLNYESKRRTPDCGDYKVSHSAFAFGDPHFLTFDGTNYTFNGFAEYWLLHVKDLEGGMNFQLQARMENSTGTLGKIKATVITAVAMRQGASPSYETSDIMLLLNPPFAVDRLSVYVGGMYQEFYTVKKRIFVDASGHEILIVRNGKSGTNNNFTVVFDNGVSVNIAEKAGLLQVMTTVPHVYFEKTSGLFGFLDGNKNNDLRLRDGRVEVDPSNTKDVHEKFGADWAVSANESIFHYFGGKNWQYFEKDKDFMPNFEPAFPSATEHNVTENMVQETCKGNLFCRFDYMTTLSQSVAEASLQTEAWAYELKTMSTEVPACPYLYVERSLRKPSATYTVGSTVELTGCLSGYSLRGATSFTCTANGNQPTWQPDPHGTECKNNQDIAAEQQRMAIAIAVPITLVVLFAIIAVALFVFLKRPRVKKEASPLSTWQNASDSLPHQQPPVNPDQQPGLYENMGTNLNKSQTSISSQISKTSHNSIILSQTIHAQRPPRPRKTPSTNGEMQMNPSKVHEYQGPYSEALNDEEKVATTGPMTWNKGYDNKASVPDGEKNDYVYAQVDRTHPRKTGSTAGATDDSSSTNLPANPPAGTTV